jgi:hypothetical protein
MFTIDHYDGNPFPARQPRQHGTAVITFEDAAFVQQYAANS